MHLKNLALLKIAHSGDAAFRTVRLAPVYDTLTTRVFPGLAHDRMALKLGGKDERLRRADFVALATLAGLRAGDAQAAIDDVLLRLPSAVDALVIPRTLALTADARTTVDRTLELCRSRVAAFD
jgi:serine/threonine-protein kinase HipA